MVLATPGHPGTDCAKAQQLLRELMRHPETLLPAERAMAFLELQIDDHLTLRGGNRRLQADAVRADQDRRRPRNRRLQVETDENARLHKELDDAHAKLDAIANIERALNKPKSRRRRAPGVKRAALNHQQTQGPHPGRGR